ncbi:MAG: carboxypeptidase regulatory-like domain-containing protein [Acidobacteria bacterium]|nr:carboxypeptidase regulatory-like domain-containing protein [Acidobacteriota bacterium]
MPANVFRICLLLTLLAAMLHGQQAGGTISGTVLDGSGAPVPAARVAIRNTSTNGVFRTATNETGFYTGPGLAVGQYEVTAEADGFKKSVRTGITLEVDQRAMVNFALTIGSLTESVEVVADAPLVDVGSATVGKVVENRRIQELPLNGRNALALALLTPGVKTSVGPTYSGFIDRGVRISTMSINNSPGGMNDQLLDGNHNVLTWINEVAVPPAVDAVEEFKVQSGTMSAEFGYTAGGVVNLVTKSGTNAFHGTLYEFFRNDKLDARNAFAPTRERLRYNQFGGSAGGPIRRDKTFFFGNYEEYRVRQGSPRVGTVPVAAERRGDFSNTRTASGSLIVIYNPATTRRDAQGNLVRDVFPNNVIPESRLDPVAPRALELIPLPNRTPTNAFTNSQNYQTQIVPTTDSRQYHGRVDHKLTANNSLFARISWFNHKPFQKQVIFPGDMFGRIDDMSNKNVSLSDTHVFSPTLINEFRVGVVRQAFAFADASYGQDWPRKLGLAENVPGDVIPTVGIAGYTSIGYGLVGKRGSLNWNFQDTATKIRGNHTLKIGFEHRLLEGNNRQTRYPSGNFSFTSALTGNPARPAGTGSSVASLVLGSVRQATLDQSQGISMHAYATGVFVQDDWKVTRRLTLNLGLRYDFQQQPVERHDRLLQFDLSGRSASGLTGRTVYAGVNGEPRQWRDEDYTDFGPRFGFAWDILGKGTTVLRGGYGIYYPFTFYSNGSFGSQGLGFSSMTTTYLPAGGDFNYPAFQFRSGFPYPPLQPLGASGGDDAFLGQSVPFTESTGPSPRAQQWNLSLQQQLPGRWLVDITYSGNKGTHFIGAPYDINQLDPQYLSLGQSLQDKVPNPYAGRVPGSLGAATITRLQSLVPFPYYNDIEVTNSHTGNYFSNLLLLSVQKKTTHGLTLLFSYTGGKLISDPLRLPQADFGENQARLKSYQNGKFDRRGERSVDPQDVSRRAVVSAVYELPFGQGKRWNPANGLARKLAGGWQITTIGTMQTGLPIAVTGANNFLASRPNSTGQSAKLPNPTAANWFNTDVFVNPPAYTYGNTGRTLPDVRAPGTVNWDVSVLKAISVTERLNVQFRAEAFNLLNHVNLGLPNSAFVAGRDGKNASGSFGVITSARDARQIQFGLKLRF